MGRTINFDFGKGGGSGAEFLIGLLSFEPTSIHTSGSRVILPSPSYAGVSGGMASLPDVVPSPAGPAPEWGYRVKVTDSLTDRAWSWLVSVPEGTGSINFSDLPALTPIPPTNPPFVDLGELENANQNIADLQAGLADPRLPHLGPNAGTAQLYTWAVTDPAGRVSEMRLGVDGLVPADVLAAWSKRMPGVGAVRTAGVALTVPDSLTPSAAHNNVTARLPIKIGAKASRVRVHIANRNDRNNTAYAGALSFTGVYIGALNRTAAGNLGGQFLGTPVQVAGAFTSPADGSEWTSGWIDYVVEPGKEYMLSYGYTSAAQDNHLAAAGGWQSANANDVAAASPTVTTSKTMPLDVWLEVEVPASTKVIGYLGDSLTAGIRSSYPVYDSWPSRHALANGLIHSVYAAGGSRFTEWVPETDRRLTKWDGLSKPDAFVVALGNNDIFNGSDLPTTQAAYIAMLATLRKKFTARIYAATILPRLAPDAGQEAVRKAYNAWLQGTLPAGTHTVFDMAAVIDDGTGNTDTRWRSEADNFHLNTAGYARCSQTINAPLA